MDRQGEVFRDATETDWATGAVLEGAVRHEPGSEGLSPEEWEALGWDDGREGPKTLDQARVALAGRIADPAAPDDDTVAHAYDDLEA